MFIFFFSTFLYLVLSMVLNSTLQDIGVTKSLQKAIVISFLTFIITLPVGWIYHKISDNSPDNIELTEFKDLTPAQKQQALRLKQTQEAMQNLQNYQSMQQ